MHDPARVQVCQRAGQLTRRPLERRPPRGLVGQAGQTVDRRSGDPLRHQKHPAVAEAPDVEHPHDAGVRERLQPRELVEGDPPAGHVGREDLRHPRAPPVSRTANVSPLAPCPSRSPRA